MLDTPFPEISEARDNHAAAQQHPVPQQTSKDSAVAKVDLLALALSRFGAWRAGAEALVERYRAVAFDLSTPKGYAELVKAIAEVRAPRYQAQNVAKASKSELAGVSKAIGAEEAAVTAFLDDTEKRLVALRDAHDAKAAADKAEAKRLDDERIAKHQAGIATIRSFLSRCQGLPAARIALGIYQLQVQTYSSDDWQEFAVTAANEQCQTLDAMRSIHALAVMREADAALAEARRVEREAEQARQAAENTRIAAELAERQRVLDAQAAAIAANTARIKRLQALVDEIHASAIGDERQTAWDISEAITAVEFLTVGEAVYGELAPLARSAQASTLATLRAMHAAATAAEELAAASQAQADEAQRADAYAQQHATEAAAAISADADRPPAVDQLGDPVAQPAPAQSPPPPPSPQPANLNLGDINARFGGRVRFDAAGLALMGIEHSATDKAARLYRESDIGRICSALVKLAGEVSVT